MAELETVEREEVGADRKVGEEIARGWSLRRARVQIPVELLVALLTGQHGPCVGVVDPEARLAQASYNEETGCVTLVLSGGSLPGATLGFCADWPGPLWRSPDARLPGAAASSPQPYRRFHELRAQGASRLEARAKAGYYLTIQEWEALETERTAEQTDVEER